jgi:hypothetical protein
MLAKLLLLMTGTAAASLGIHDGQHFAPRLAETVVRDSVARLGVVPVHGNPETNSGPLIEPPTSLHE